MKSQKLTLKKIVLAAMFAALACVATMVINIPIPATGGYINLGDCIVILSGWLLGGAYGAAAGGIGSMLADLIPGYASFAPGTLVIKALMAFVACVAYKALAGVNGFVARLLSAVFAEAVMVFGYFLYEATALGYGIGALGAIPGNLVQAVGGIVISVLVMELIKNNRMIMRLMKE